MSGSTDTTTILGKRLLRHRAAAWSAALALCLAQLLLSAHVHASVSPDEPPEVLCAACALVDDDVLAGLSPDQAAPRLRQRTAKLRILGIVIERHSHPFQPRAPPSP